MIAPPTHAGSPGSSHGTGAISATRVIAHSSFSANATAIVDDAGTPSRRFSVITRSTSPARAGAIAEPANAAIV
ncbi:MAG: hypothetical protein WKG01_12480 [Kofleriaceae bacterium]